MIRKINIYVFIAVVTMLFSTGCEWSSNNNDNNDTNNSGIASKSIKDAIVGKSLYKPVISNPSGLLTKNLFRKVSRVEPAAAHRPVVEEYVFNADGTHLTFSARYADDGVAFVTEEYMFSIEDGYLEMTTVTSTGAESFPVGTVIKLHILKIDEKHIDVKIEETDANNGVVAGEFTIYYDAGEASKLAT